MKDWLLAILIAWFIYVYVLGGSLAGLNPLITRARSIVSQPAGGIGALEQAAPVQPQVQPMVQQPAARSPANAMPPAQPVTGQSDPGPLPPTPQPLPPNWGDGLKPVEVDTPRAVFVAPDPALGPYFNINGYYLYCSQITDDLQYTGDATVKEWWDRLSQEVKKIQKSMC